MNKLFLLLFLIPMLSSAAPEFIEDDCSVCEKTYPNGHKYVGSWKNGNQTGAGTYTWPDGQKYVGSFKNGMRDGNGAQTYPNGHKYVGSWKNDNQTGVATYTWPNGLKYVGSWKNGMREGVGTQTYVDGEYVGSWKNDKFDSGTMEIIKEGKKHSIVFLDGKELGEKAGQDYLKKKAN